MIDIFAFYFPQFYVTPENSEWWGENFTDWRLVKKAKPQFTFHKQPRIPADGYHDQSQSEVIKKQAKLAISYGIKGFNFYHYWFNGKSYLDVPIKNLLSQSDINLNFMVTWANESWTRQWIGKPNEYLIKQNYYNNEKDMQAHYEYLSVLFKDERYYKINNKPVMNIYRPELVPNIKSVIDFFNKLAIGDGFNGIHFIACRSYEVANAERVYAAFDGVMNFNPRYCINFHIRKKSKLSFESFARMLPESFQSTLSRFRKTHRGINKYDYDDYLASMKSSDNFFIGKPVYHSVFPDWDNTARYNNNATLFVNVSADKYKEALRLAVENLTSIHEPLLFINAWNEWSESAYLEPDKAQGNLLLEITKEVLSQARAR